MWGWGCAPNQAANLSKSSRPYGVTVTCNSSPFLQIKVNKLHMWGKGKFTVDAMWKRGRVESGSKRKRESDKVDEQKSDSKRS